MATGSKKAQSNGASNGEDARHELREMAEQLSKAAAGARLVADAASAEDVSAYTERARAALYAWVGVREHDGAPYPDAWKLMASGIAHHSGQPGDPDVQAASVAAAVAGLYPRIATKLVTAERRALIAAAIRASKPSRIAWKKVAECWAGIEAREPSAEAMRVEWSAWSGWKPPRDP